MKTRRLLTIIAMLSLSLLVFLIAFDSVILGNEKASEPTTETPISQIQDLRKEIEALEERISRLESGQKIPRAASHISRCATRPTSYKYNSAHKSTPGVQRFTAERDQRYDLLHYPAAGSKCGAA